MTARRTKPPVAVTAIGGATVWRIATTGYVAVVLAVVLQAAVQSSSAAARESGPRQAASGEQPALDSRSRSSPSEDLTCAGLGARDLAQLRDDADLRAEIDELCRTTAAMKYADEARFPFPVWLVLVAAVVGVAFSVGLVWYYCIRHDTDLPWFWKSWW